MVEDPRHLNPMERVDAEREWIFYHKNNGLDSDTPENLARFRQVFLDGMRFGTDMADKAKARESFQLERFKRAYVLSGQLYRLLTQCLMVLNNIRKRLIVGPDSKPVDTLGIGQTIEVVATALQSAKNIILTLDRVEPDANGHPKNG